MVGKSGASVLSRKPGSNRQSEKSRAPIAPTYRSRQVSANSGSEGESGRGDDITLIRLSPMRSEEQAAEETQTLRNASALSPSTAEESTEWHLIIRDLKSCRAGGSWQSRVNTFFNEVCALHGTKLRLRRNIGWDDRGNVVKIQFELAKTSGTSQNGNARELSAEIYKFLLCLFTNRGGEAITRLSASGIHGLEVTSSDDSHQRLYHSKMQTAEENRWFVDESLVDEMIKDLTLFQENKGSNVLQYGVMYPSLAPKLQEVKVELERRKENCESCIQKVISIIKRSQGGGNSSQTIDLLVDSTCKLLLWCSQSQEVLTKASKVFGNKIVELLESITPEMIKSGLLVIFEGFALLGKLRGADNEMLKLAIDRSRGELRHLLNNFRQRHLTRKLEEPDLFAQNFRSQQNLAKAMAAVEGALEHSAFVIVSDRDNVKYVPGSKCVIASGLVSACGGAGLVLGSVATAGLGPIILSIGGLGFLAASLAGSYIIEPKFNGYLKIHEPVFDTLLDVYQSLHSVSRLFNSIHFDHDKGYQMISWRNASEETVQQEAAGLGTKLKNVQANLEKALSDLDAASSMEGNK